MRRQKTLNFFLCTLLATVSLLASCTPAAAPAAPAQPATSAPAAKPTTAEPIKIGWMGVKSGASAMLGEWDRRGILLAFEAKNAAGGIKGRPLTLVEYDDEADPTKAVSLAQKLCNDDKVIAAFAATNSTTTLAAVPVFAQCKIPHITGGINQAILQQGSAYAFRNTASGPMYEQFIIKYMVGKGYKKFALIFDNSAYGQGESKYQLDALKEANLTPVAQETYGVDDKDFTGQLSKIIKAQPDVILFGGVDVASGLIAKQARGMGYEGKFAGNGSVGTAKFMEVGGDATEGVIFSSPYISADANDITKAWDAAYQKRWNEPAESHGAKAYDGAMVLIKALEAAYPDLTGERIATELHKVCGYKGVQGEFCFDKNGEGVASMQIGIVEKGKVNPIKQ